MYIKYAHKGVVFTDTAKEVWKLELNSGSEKEFLKVFPHILFLQEDYFWRTCIFFFFFNENYHLTDSLKIEKYLEISSPSAVF